MYKQYLLVQNIVIGVSYERSVVCVEKLLTRNLSEKNKHSVLVGMQPCTMTITSNNYTYSSFGSRIMLPFDEVDFAMLKAQKYLTGNCWQF